MAREEDCGACGTALCCPVLPQNSGAAAVGLSLLQAFRQDHCVPRHVKLSLGHSTFPQYKPSLLPGVGPRGYSLGSLVNVGFLLLLWGHTHKSLAL